MEIKVLIPAPAIDFNSGSTSNSPYVTAPSTPQRLGNYFFSAPTSPTHSTAFFNLFDGEKEFAFDLQSERASVPADELFDEGKIKPLKPPPLFQYSNSPKSLKSLYRGAPLSSTHSSSSSCSVSTWYRKWKLKDLLFRSKSEGSARNGKEPLMKYSVLKKNESDNVKNWSFRPTRGSGGSELKRKGSISAHELHYMKNRAVAEEMKRKTYLPYKRGLLGCLRFNSPPVVVHEISRGFGIN